MRKGSEIRSNMCFVGPYSDERCDYVEGGYSIVKQLWSCRVYACELLVSCFCGAIVFTLISVLGCFPRTICPPILHDIFCLSLEEQPGLYCLVEFN